IRFLPELRTDVRPGPWIGENDPRAAPLAHRRHEPGLPSAGAVARASRVALQSEVRAVLVADQPPAGSTGPGRLRLPGDPEIDLRSRVERLEGEGDLDILPFARAFAGVDEKLVAEPPPGLDPRPPGLGAGRPGRRVVGRIGDEQVQ